MKKQRTLGIIPTVAIVFLFGVVLSGVITFFTQRYWAANTVNKQTEDIGSFVAAETAAAVREYPAADWLLNYWYEHHAEMDVEYDVQLTGDTVTHEKCRLLNERHPDLLPDYAEAQQLEALPPEDQKLYAEIIYSWLITRINDIAASNNIDYLFCVLTEEPFDRQFFLFSANPSGSERGTIYEQAYTLGTTAAVNASQQEAMRAAQIQSAHLADAGNYVDYYSSLGTVGDRVALIGLTKNTSALWGSMSEMTLIGTLQAISIQVWISLICLVLIFLFVLSPLKSVQQNIRLYKETKDGSKVTAIRTRNEIGQLSEDVVSLAKEIDDHVHKIESITAEKQRIDTELNLASKIQAKMLPDQFPPFPERTEFEIFAAMDPAREVSGDFYDFFMVDDDHLAMMIADVSGKGVPAALFMTISMVLIHNSALMEKRPAKALEYVNRQLYQHNPQRMFVSVWLGILELSTGKLTVSNAGHEYPFVRLNGRPYQLLKDEHSFVIGGLPDITTEEYEMQLSAGDSVFVYTDGLPEATDADNQFFGMERTLAALNRAPDAGPEQVIANMKEAVDDFVKKAEQFDDLTMMCFRYLGPAGKKE